MTFLASRLDGFVHIRAFDHRGRSSSVYLHDIRNLRFAAVRRAIRYELRAQLGRP